MDVRDCMLSNNVIIVDVVVNQITARCSVHVHVARSVIDCAA